MAETDRAYFEKRLRIDVNDLDTMLVEHAELARAVGSGYARAVSERDYEKKRLEIVDARVAKTVATSLSERGERVTDRAVKEGVLRSKAHAAAVDDMTDAIRETEEWDALREAFRARGFALRDLVQMHLRDYYATTSSERYDREARSAREAMARDRAERRSK